MFFNSSVWEFMNIQSLSTPERILLAEKLWDSIYTHSDEVILTPRQKELLDERLYILDSDENIGDSWEAVKNRIIKK